MNKNIINIGILLSSSVLSELSSLTAPMIELYTDNLVHKVKMVNSRPFLTQISKAKIGKRQVEISPALISSSIVLKSETCIKLDEAQILVSVVEKIKNSKPLSEEFSKIINDNFWDLI